MLLLLLALRLPFYLTRHVQEDAYISLRSAQNLALTGVYGFNAGERISASTSHLYVFIAAIVRLLVGEPAFIPVVLIFNTMFLLIGTWFIARALADERSRKILLWVFLSVIPISLLTSYSGMETSLLILVTGALLYLMKTRQRRLWVLLGLAALPWIRPDAVAFALLLVFWDMVHAKRFKWLELIAVMSGLVTLLVFNKLYFGAFLHQSITAKMLMRHSFTLRRLADNLVVVFSGQGGGFLAPIRSRVFDPFGFLFSGLIIMAMGLYLWRRRRDRDQLVTALTVASLALAIPAVYAFGGVLYQWYFWPSAIFAMVFPLALLAERWGSKDNAFARMGRAGIVLLFIIGAVGQLAFSYAWGMKEFTYRGGIGIWLKETADEHDRIFLEPAGYIPFYSGLYTYDEVGLVTPQVVTYRKAYGERWWPEFVMDFKPDWIIQRGQISDYQTYQGYTLRNDEIDWLDENYRLEARFTFKPEEFARSPLTTWLLTMGEADDYFIFRWIGD